MKQISIILIYLFTLHSYHLSAQQQNQKKTDVIVPSKFTLPYAIKTDYRNVKYKRLPDSQIIQPDDPEQGIYAEDGEIRYIPLPSKGEYSVILVPYDGGDFPYRYYLHTFKGNKVIDGLYVEGEWQEPGSDDIQTTFFSIDTAYTIIVSTNTGSNSKKKTYRINGKGKFYEVKDKYTSNLDTTW